MVNAELLLNPLKTFGVSPHAQSIRDSKLNQKERVRERTQQVESHINEAIIDLPVSNLYRYWVDHTGKFYSDNSLKKKFEIGESNYQFFDPRERGGYPGKGFEILKRELLENPDKVILWYSPIGKTDFDNDPTNPYHQIDHYDYGQLYVQYFDGEYNRVDTVAVKIGNEEALREFSPELDQMLQIEDEETRIKKFLLNPIVLQQDKETFINTKRNNLGVYEDNDGNFYTISHIIHHIQRSFNGEIDPRVREISDSIGNYIKTNDTSTQASLNIYLAAIQNYLLITGKDATILKGSCGGLLTRKKGIDSLLNLNSIPEIGSLDLYSSGYRKTFQTGQRDYKKDPNLCTCGNQEPHFHCPGSKDGKACNHAITVGLGINQCPSCGKGATCN